MVDLGPIWGLGPSVIRSIFVICPMITAFAPGLVGTFQDSEVRPERHAPAPRSGLPVSRSIGEPLADNAAQRPIGALYVVHAEHDPVVVSKIKLGEVTMQVFFADMLVNAIDAALEDREVSLSGIGGRIAARVIDGAVTGEPLASFPVNAALVGSQVRSDINFGLKDWTQIGGSHLWDMMGTDAPFTFDQSDDGFLRGGISISAVPGFAADESFVRLNKFALAAERPGVVNMEVHHRLAEAMRQEPCGLQGDAEHAAELVGAHTLLAGAKQVHCLQPDMQFNMAGLEDGADLDSKGLAAGVAFVHPDAGALAPQWPALVDNAAVRTWPAIGPQPRLDEPIGGFFAMEMIGGKDGRHGVSP